MVGTIVEDVMIGRNGTSWKMDSGEFWHKNASLQYNSQVKKAT
jgi:hypothetical protein